MLDEYLMVAEGLRPQGLDGTLKVRVYMDDAKDIIDLNALYIREQEQYRPVKIERAVERAGFAYLKLNGVSSRNDAEKLRGAYFYMCRADAPKLPDGRFYICDLIGCTVVDSQGDEVGVVQDVLTPGANDVYVLAGARGEVLLPVISKLILETNIKSRRIIVDAKTLFEVAVFEN